MEEFKKYLHRKGHIKNTIHYKIRDVEHYLAWLQINHLVMEQMRYADLMNYLGQLQQEGKLPREQNNRLLAIETYYNFKRLPSVIQGLRIKIKQSTLKPVLDIEELEAVYQQYDPYTTVAQLILSLVIWQALEPEDIVRIELQDINLSKGQLYIKSRSQRQARYIKLEVHQIMQLHDYMAATKVKREQANTQRLMIGTGSLPGTWRRLNKEVVHQSRSKLNIPVRSLQHLRQSRLAYWVNRYGLRQAQYLGGFKSVKGIEYYQTRSLKDLQQQLERCHPLK